MYSVFVAYLFNANMNEHLNKHTCGWDEYMPTATENGKSYTIWL